MTPMMKPAKRLFEFGPYRVDTADRLLLKSGQVVPLPPKVFDILLAFVERSGRVLDKAVHSGQFGGSIQGLLR